MYYACPIGTFKGAYDLPVRHAIDFTGITDLKKINIPVKLTEFREFLYNTKARRISFKVARLSYCATRAKWFEDNQMYQKGIFFSVDPQIHEFNKIFLEANPHLSYTETNPNGIQTYDFVDKDDDQSGAIKAINDLKKIFNLLPSKINTGINILLVGIIAITLVKFSNTINKKKETANNG